MAFAGGSGTAVDPYQITTMAHFDDVQNNLSACFIVMNDIDFLNTEIDGVPGTFTGDFDGDGHTFSNLVIKEDTSGTTTAGLFQNLSGSGARIENLTLDNCDIKMGGSQNKVGWFAGYMKLDSHIADCTAWNCPISPLINGENCTAGGICGEIYGATIEDCVSDFSAQISGVLGGIVGYIDSGAVYRSHSKGTLKVTSGNVGGVAGFASESRLQECSSKSDVTSNSGYAGGLVGGAQIYNGSSWIQDCCATGDVVCSSGHAGGLVGYLDADRKLGGSGWYTVTNTHATGAVTSATGVTSGGLIGEVYGVSLALNSSYYDTDTTGQTDVGKGVPESTSDMMLSATFVGWNFTSPWSITETTTYPYLYTWPSPEEDTIIDRRPLLLIRWRNDNRGRWSAYREVSLGETGDSTLVKTIRRLGCYQTRQYELVWSDEVPVVIAAFDEHIEGSEEAKNGS